jgi:hypothetical protein
MIGPEIGHLADLLELAGFQTCLQIQGFTKVAAFWSFIHQVMLFVMGIPRLLGRAE